MTTTPDEVVSARSVASAEIDDVLAQFGTSRAGLTSQEAARRSALYGPNAVRSHRVSAWAVLGRQLRSAILVLLAVTAVISFFLGSSTDAVVIGVILTASIGLGFANEYRAERATAALHSNLRHHATVMRDNRPTEVDVAELVPGDLVDVVLGAVVPADVRLISATGLECDESVLTGESEAVEKHAAPGAATSPGATSAGATDSGLDTCVFMGTIVRAGTGTGVVFATGAKTAFGDIAAGLGERHPDTDFQRGLRKFSNLLLRVAIVLISMIVVINLLLDRPLLESLLFALAIAVGITPQLLPAVVSTSLASGSRQLAKRKVLVKRLVCIEDLGDLDILLTDKTGTLTEGRISFVDAVDPSGSTSRETFLYGLLATEYTGGTEQVVAANAMDSALWAAPGAAEAGAQRYERLASLPFDHTRCMTSVLVAGPNDEHLLIVKGAPEKVLARCVGVGPEADETLTGLFAEGGRVVAVATASTTGKAHIDPADENGLTLRGFLVFLDKPKQAATESLRELAALQIEVKIATGDNPLVAEHVCAQLGLASGGTITGAELEGLDDEAFADAAQRFTIFARVLPEQKSRLVKVLRQHGRSVGFLGDGVNDALALHSADVGISVDTATDVAKDAADILLLDKDLGVLAGGVAEGRRIFANTMKYVLMGTSSNFGNMFSAAAASAVLTFLPMLPSQVLLNNLLYDSSQLAIPTDKVDDEQVHAPSHWDIAFIRRFMLFFGPVSSMFDFLTFGIMIGLFNAGPELFRTGWFLESIATQTLIVFAIRTRRVPFLRSRPSVPLVLAVAAVVAVAIGLTVSPLAHDLGFTTLPIGFFLVLVLLVIAYLVIVELAKLLFYSEPIHPAPFVRKRGLTHRIHRRAARFSAG
ncbi:MULTISPECIES: magnesium-translocating P-type ATPase [Gordonia]|nr:MULTISPECIES: magnesium-translocating P-type ATPase [Gordonia]KAF0967764.1 Magnesium-transporting ATPase, P-type 1 [Gordonia sp. YY1]MCR8896571.1 magnesium-translocating P-type ATPase [Gordonia sp. GONU]